VLLTIKEAATHLNVSPRTVRKAIDSGALKVVRLTQTRWGDRIHPDDLETYINSNRVFMGKPYLSINKAKHEGSSDASYDALLAAISDVPRLYNLNRKGRKRVAD